MDHGGMDMSPPSTDHGGTGMSPPPSMAAMRHHFMHMTFFWGKDSEILFSGWPGDRGGGMYALALAVVFALAFLVEWLNHSRLVRPGACSHVAAAARSAVHAVRVALAYLVMLAIMSFNGGVMVAAVAGHAVGFLLFGSSASGRADGEKGDLPPMSC